MCVTAFNFRYRDSFLDGVYNNDITGRLRIVCAQLQKRYLKTKQES